MARIVPARYVFHIGHPIRVPPKIVFGAGRPLKPLKPLNCCNGNFLCDKNNKITFLPSMAIFIFLFLYTLVRRIGLDRIVSDTDLRIVANYFCRIVASRIHIATYRIRRNGKSSRAVLCNSFPNPIQPHVNPGRQHESLLDPGWGRWKALPQTPQAPIRRQKIKT